MASAIEMVPFTQAHLDGALALSREAGWPHRREDWEMALGLSQGIVAIRDGTVLGTALLTPFDENAATLNMVIVAASLRGQGLGRRLMDAALAICGERECRLVATREGLPLYEKFGFLAGGEIAQHQGVARELPPRPGGVALRPAQAEDLPRLLAMDREAHGTDRSRLLRALFARGRFVIAEQGGTAAGLACLRGFGRGQLIGPVLARDVETARALILDLASRSPGDFLRIDTAAATGIGPWVASFGLDRVGGGVAMTRPGARRAAGRPAASPLAIYALVAQAFG